MCSKHGEYEAKITVVMGHEIKTACPQCVLPLVSVQSAKHPSWVTKRREHMTFDNYKAENERQSIVLSRVCKYAENFKRVLELGTCLTLIGPPGTGKTHLATSMALSVNASGFSVAYYSLYDLLTRLKATYGKASTETEQVIIKNLSQIDLLVLDEVGLKNLSETDLALTYQVIDKRYENIKPTVIISNLSLKDLETCLGERTVDRFYENHGTVLVCDWSSHRRKK